MWLQRFRVRQVLFTNNAALSQVLILLSRVILLHRGSLDEEFLTRGCKNFGGGEARARRSVAFLQEPHHHELEQDLAILRVRLCGSLVGKLRFKT